MSVTIIKTVNFGKNKTGLEGTIGIQCDSNGYNEFGYFKVK